MAMEFHTVDFQSIASNESIFFCWNWFPSFISFQAAFQNLFSTFHDAM